MKIKVKRSYAGLGLFADQSIKKGEYIIDYQGEYVDNDKVSSGRYWFYVNKKYSIDGKNRSNIARYLNHSCKPNARAVIYRSKIYFRAIKSIKCGEEITIDYGKEYFDGYIQSIGCKCGNHKY